MKKKPRILFLMHSASRNGATILLLHLLRWLKGTVDWEIEVLVHGSGPLLDEIRSVAPTTVWRSSAALLPAFLRPRMTRWQSRLDFHCLQALLAGRRFDLIYANTVAVWPLVKALSNRAPVLIWHIHELVYALRLTIDNQRVSELFHATSRFIVVSNSVREALSCEFKVRDDRMDTVQGFVPIINLDAEEQRSRRERVRKGLGWPEDVFVVGGCGTLGWRKGTDLFVQIARAVSNTKGYEKVRFLWVGGGAEDKEALEFTHDLITLGLQERCCRVPTTADVLDYYSAMDVLALTSREDPFPLVMLEAGLQSIPVVCFANSGGATEFVGEDAGLIAPYLDVAAFAEHLMRLQDTPRLRERLGAAAAAKVRTNNSIAVQAPKLLKIIEDCLPNEDEKTVARRKRSKASPVPAERL